MTPERREFPRLADSNALRYRVVGGANPADALDDGLQLNISGGGIAFVAQERLECGERLALELQLPGFPSSIIAMAKVVWVDPRKSGQGHEVGAEFHWVGWGSDGVQQQISNYVKSALND